MSSRLFLRVGASAAFAAAFLLAVQVAIALPLGSDIALLGTSLDPAQMTRFFGTNAFALTYMMTADDGFAIAYAIVFVVIAYYLLPRARLVGILALVFSLLTALTDLSENSLYLAAVATVTQKQALETPILLALFWLGQVKYLAMYLAAILFAVGIWPSRRGGRVLAILLALFPVVGLVAISFPVLAIFKLLWMCVLLIAGGVFLLAAAKTSEVS